MRVFLSFFVLVLLFSIPSLSCEDWFKTLNISGDKNCTEKCRVAEVDMGTLTTKAMPVDTTYGQIY